MAAKRRIAVRLESWVESLARIGHNNGPPLDVTYKAWLWRRAHARAWKTPPREITMPRLGRAEGLGLSYRDYAAVLLDRGARLAAIVLAPGAVDPVRLVGNRPEHHRAAELAGFGRYKQAADYFAAPTVPASASAPPPAQRHMAPARRRPSAAPFLVPVWGKPNRG